MKIHMLGVCGTGMGSVAGMLKQLGHDVRGSDEHVYPPMSDKLRDWEVRILEGFDAAHLNPTPDLAIVGNVIRKHNPEAEFVRENNIDHISMPEAVARFAIEDRHSLVVTGTHGKTSTSALLAHVLMHAGSDPGYLVAGALTGYPDSCRYGQGDYFVVEGDEYDTAYFDKGPKFLHYKPKTVIITSLEFDHADIYDSVEQIEESFRKLIQLIPKDGRLIVAAGAERAVRLACEHASCPVLLYSPDSEADCRMTHYESGPGGLVFNAVVAGRSYDDMRVPLWGRFSAENVLAVLGALQSTDLKEDQIRAGLVTYAGVQRRLEVLGEPNGITVVDDFGHHPTAIRETVAAARTRWPGRRLWALFEPRSATSRRNVFQTEFMEALGAADRVVVGFHERLLEIDAAERFDAQGVAETLSRRGTPAAHLRDADAIVDHITADAIEGDVVLIFSNGSFGGLHSKLVQALA